MGHFPDHIEARCVMCYRLLLVLTIMSESGPLNINCWMIGTPLPRIATITFKDRESTISHLKDELQRRWAPTFNNICATEIHLWAVCISIDTPEEYQQQGQTLKLEDELNGGELIRRKIT